MNGWLQEVLAFLVVGFVAAVWIKHWFEKPLRIFLSNRLLKKGYVSYAFKVRGRSANRFNAK